MAARNRVVLSGTLGTSEVWSTGIHFMGNAGAGDLVVGAQDLQSWAQEIAAVLPTLVTGGIENALSNSGALTRVDTYAYGQTGPATAVGSAPVSGVVGGSSSLAPFQTSMVFSLRSDFAGSSYRGRCYWPAVGADISGGLFSGSGLANYPQAFVQMLNGIAEAANDVITVGDVKPAIYSPTRDDISVCTRVEWDTVPDIQRRRADALTGVRYSFGTGRV